MNLKDFNQTYFYKTNLIKLCKNFNLPTYGTKAELNDYIRLYLSGIDATQIHVNRKKHYDNKLLASDISLDTKLINSGFSFNKEARKFFGNYYNIDHFSFTKKMAIIKREAESNNDVNITVGDLINKIGSNNQIVNTTVEESTYQWNNFVSDFLTSNESNEFNDKLKVASILWKHVRDSSNEKIYTSNLINDYFSEINKYLKKAR
ncbi:hypothetical protein GSH19_04135 [Lactobacillus sp. S2-2]|uniref:SAP domain-containing protein n=1 Tax=Lactobacillus sp. S2-2 TaxID=2692917 RepID=UPI001F44F386|nr:SAP domain-containing protein [Lactobacillus sp. S2-2]MCF6515344.1 hypothetical protein [Lactobacillus sp. S2-2]